MINANALKRYCEMCDRWWGARAYSCPACGDKTVPRARVKASDEKCQACKGKGWVTPSIKMYPGDRVPCSCAKPAAPVSSSAHPDRQTVERPITVNGAENDAMIQLWGVIAHISGLSLSVVVQETREAVHGLVREVRQEQANARPARTLALRCETCQHFKRGSNDPECFEPTLIAAGNNGSLMVRPDFGCSLHSGLDALLSGGAPHGK